MLIFNWGAVPPLSFKNSEMHVAESVHAEIVSMKITVEAQNTYK